MAKSRAPLELSDESDFSRSSLYSIAEHDLLRLYFAIDGNQKFRGSRSDIFWVSDKTGFVVHLSHVEYMFANPQLNADD